HQLMIGREPDLTILVDMDPATGLERALGRGTGEARFEAFGQELQQQIRADFLAMAQEFPDRFVTVDGGRAIEKVAADIQAIVARHLP
ncbi:Thymidylate kinase, partial [hydrothermal vent metagenome]